MKSFLNLIRWKNLLLVAITQYAIRAIILLPCFKSEQILPHLNEWQFLSLVISTLLVAAGGYIINDYYDIEIDKINKPKQVIIGKKITKRMAIFIYSFITVIGLILSITLAIQLDKLILLPIYPTAVLLLFLYARNFKKLALIGNLIVAAFTAGVLLITF
ncbi:MAG: UbiA family prenyltransferase, partial [Bacteroidota bacterium]